MENNLDVNILIQTFSEKVNQLSNDLVVKDAVIAQLTKQLEAYNQHMAQHEVETASVAASQESKKKEDK